MSNILHKVKDVVTGHHHGKESKDSNKRQQGSSTGTAGSNPSAGNYNPNEQTAGTGGAGNYPSGTGEHERSGAGQYAPQPAAGQYSSGTGDYGRSEGQTLGGNAPGGSSYSTQPGPGQYTEGARGYDTSKMGSHMESGPRQQQQRGQW